MNIEARELFSLRPYNNWVLLKPIQDMDTFKVGNVNLFLDTTYKPEFHQKVIHEVVAVPKKLIFDRKLEVGESMEWKTDMELKVGDKVWINYLSAIRGHKVTCEGQDYMFVPYASIYLKQTRDGVKMLNGYVLCEPVYIKKKSEIATIEIIKHESMQGLAKDCRHGIVRYFGKPITEYYYDTLSPDDDYITEGHTVMFTTPNQVRLEHGYHQNLDGKEYIVSRRNRMEGIVKFDESLVDIEK